MSRPGMLVLERDLKGATPEKLCRALFKSAQITKLDTAKSNGKEEKRKDDRAKSKR